MGEHKHKRWLREMEYSIPRGPEEPPPTEPTIMFLLYTGAAARRPLPAASVERSGTRWTFNYPPAAGMITRMLIANCEGFFLTGIWVGDTGNHIVEAQPLSRLVRAGLAFVRYIPPLAAGPLGLGTVVRVSIDTEPTVEEEVPF